MRNDGQKSGDGGALVPRPGRGSNGIIPNSFKALSSYLRVVSSGASTVASTVRSAASAASSAIVERDGDANHDQVSWAGFDKLELERGSTRQILLLGFSYGFQVWDVEVADNVCNLVSRHDGPVSFLQLLPNPLVTKQSGDNFADSRPLLVICADGSFSGGNNDQDRSSTTCNGSSQQYHGSVNNSCVPTVVWFYSLRSQSYVHLLRFRSVVHLVRCSSRVVAVLQSSQIHCFNAATLEREYTILTNPVPIGCYGSGNIGCGPLAVGPRWMAYSGSQVAISNSGRVSPQHLTSSPTFPCPASNGSLVAHYAKESSRQLAAGIVTLGDMGYKKLSRYYSELLPEGNNGQSGTARVKVHDIVNGHSPDAENVGMVIVRDIVSKTVIAQFRAHKSPILSLCFDPSGSLLVTASVQGHNINVFRIMPGNSGGSGAASGSSYVHLYRLQRGLTNAHKRCWTQLDDKACSSGSPSSGLQVLTQQDICASGPTVTLSAVSRIKNGNNGWRNTVSGAAAAATGWSSSLCGAIASTFHNCKGNDMHGDSSSLNRNYYLLVFSPGSMTQYILYFPPAYNGNPDVEYLSKANCKERGDNIDAYAENGNPDSSKVYPEKMKCENDVFSDVLGTATKEKITMEEKHHMHISEAELQMHQNQNPLWARSEIYFQSMLTDALNIKEDGACGGEIEIERVPTRMLEARSRGLVPVFDYLQTPKSQKGRISVADGDNNGHIEPQGSDVSEYGKLAGRNSSGSLDSMANAGIIDDEYSLHDKGQDGLQFTETSGGFVNTSDTPIVNARLDNVNTRDNSVMESQLRSVHTIDGLKVENQSAEGDEFD
ncbi:UNVERIFIED_CONTAM: Autophagy-related protein 18f [Sesamum radiatum]|uniref:Autophagy-related protein 18f n=1 Tax=Sesamum radiatum TaxID=300843 RepID=A0AAW2K612_SESRA